MSYINILNKKNLSFAATLFGLMFFVSDLSGQKFWITTDEFPGGPKVGITVAGDTCLFVALENGIIRSCNEGGNFEQVLKASVTCSIYTTKNGKLMAGGAGRIFYSGNGGQTWDSVMLNSNYPVIQFIENHNGGLFAITGFNPGYVGDGILYSGNAGLSWTQRNNGLGIYRCCERVAIDKNGRLYLAMADKSISGSGGLFISEDNGNTWEHISILVDGKNVVSNQMQVGNTTGLSVSPDDSVYLSFSGVAVNAAVSMNTVKHINDVRSGSFWRNYMITNSNLWWNEKLLNNIYFAGNGDWYSSTIGTIITGATYFKKKKKNVWGKLDYGLGVSKILERGYPIFCRKT